MSEGPKDETVSRNPIVGNLRLIQELRAESDRKKREAEYKKKTKEVPDYRSELNPDWRPGTPFTYKPKKTNSIVSEALKKASEKK